MTQSIFSRTSLLLGDQTMDAIMKQRVILFGVGGVGSWCAESLVRSGIHHLTIVDSDRVSVSNINRQLMATTKTVGQVKVNVLKERLLEINPHAEIIAWQRIYSAETAEDFHLNDFDFIIDAIDSLENKAHLIRKACQTNAIFFSAMGAALKLDPQKIRVAEFWKVKGCPLARALRNKFKRQHEFPARKFLCVYSEEVQQNRGTQGNEFENADTWSAKKAQINGTLAHSVAIFGFTLAGLVVQDIVKRVDEMTKN
jgi:tRNA A37 threonylcarbamoyladenosine dehydratase